MAKKGYFSAKNVAWRELPSGYTQVKYIKSSGTQYINSGFVPNQDTRVVMKVRHSVTDAVSWLFGVRTSSGKNAFAFLAYSNKYRTDYNNIANSYYDASITAMTHVDKNKNITTLNGTEVITQTYAAFNCQYPLFLLAMNTAGTASGFASVELEEVQIYDNATLVRDYVSCINPSGEAGLYDIVNGVFYGNAGTGSFLAGDEVHSDVAREPKKVYFSDNGVARKAKKAYFGDENGIARLWYASGVPISTLAVGSSVFMNVNGVRTEFLVVHQGIPDAAMYDSSCNGTWLLMKDAFINGTWSNPSYDEQANYNTSRVHEYLNSTFYNLFSSNLKNTIKQVKIPYSKQSSGYNGANGLSAKIFLLSYVEVGYIIDYDSDFSVYHVYANGDGSVLSYFNNTDQTRRFAYLNGKLVDWWLRTPYVNYYNEDWDQDCQTVCGVYAQPISQTAPSIISNYQGFLGIRPALILPSDTLVDENFNVIA